MQHLVAVMALGMLCIVWAVVMRYSGGKGCTGTCDTCVNKLVEATAAGTAGPGAVPCAVPPQPGKVETKEACWKRRAKAGAAAALGLALGGWAAWQFMGQPAAPSASTVKLTRPLMGTLWTIEVVPGLGQAPEAVAAAIGAAFDEVARVESVMSEWKPDTPISAINANAGKDPVVVPAELRAIIERGIGWGKRSDGAFDISWRGMGKIWKFSDEVFAPPAPEVVEAGRQRVDYRKIVVDGDRVGLAEEGMAIGLGGIAKGYGVDRAATVLLEKGLVNFSLAGAGDIRLHGVNKDGQPWRVGVRNPRGGKDDLIATLGITGGAVSTSGDYERFREVDGVRYHHIIDPRTGWPARASRSVTIVAPENETADAMATAVFVLGPEKGLALVASVPGAEALIVDGEGRLHRSPGFARVGTVAGETR